MFFSLFRCFMLIIGGCSRRELQKAEQIHFQLIFTSPCWGMVHLRWMIFFLRPTTRGKRGYWWDPVVSFQPTWEWVVELISMALCIGWPAKKPQEKREDEVDEVPGYFRRWKFPPKNSHQVFPQKRWVFPKIMVPQNQWFIMRNPINMDDLGGPPLFLETPIWNHGLVETGSTRA